MSNISSALALVGIWIWKCWFLRRAENRSTRRKTSRSKEENQQQIQPTNAAGSANRTRDTLVGGERSHCSHHCAIRAPLSLLSTVTMALSISVKLLLTSTTSSYFRSRGISQPSFGQFRLRLYAYRGLRWWPTGFPARGNPSAC